MSKVRPKLVIFDFDKTIVSKDSFRMFADIAAANWAVKVYCLGLAVLLKVGLLTNLQYKRSVLRVVWYGRPVGSQSRLIEALSLRLQDWIHETVLSRLEDHVANGDRVVVMSASPEFYVRPFLERISSEVEVLASVLDEAKSPENVYGPKKAHLLRELKAERDYSAVWVYTDHKSDLPLIDLADHTCLVNPSRSLTEILSARGRQFDRI